MKREIVVEVICFLFIVLFVYAAVNKLIDYQKFTIQIGQSPLLTGFGSWLPPVVIGAELLLAIMLMIRRYRTIALYGSFGIMIMFTAYIAAILNLGSFIPCSCGGVLEKLGWEEHLIFNGVFVALAFTGAILDGRRSSVKQVNNAKTAIALLASLVSSLSIVVGLILLSDVLRDKRNSFLRLFPSHPALEKLSYDIKYDSYYIAGGNASKIYLGNKKSPLHLLVLNISDLDTQHVKLNIPGIMKQKFWSLQVAVDSPYYYAYDGAVPRIYKGNVSNWRAERFNHDEEYFLNLVPIDSNRFFVKSLNGQSSESMLGLILADSPFYYFDKNLLTKQVDGFFCTDGTMMYNRERKELIYLYRYRNEYIVMDTNLHKLSSGRTIDTTRYAKIKVATLTLHDRTTRKMQSPPLTVNKHGATYQKWLLVRSSLLARNEKPDAHDKASVIDVYELPDRIYRFSFYIHDFADKEKLKQFEIFDGILVCLFDTHVQLYRLREKYFLSTNQNIARKSGSKDRTPVKNSRSQFN